jgi:hypothetical protein
MCFELKTSTTHDGLQTLWKRLPTSEVSNFPIGSPQSVSARQFRVDFNLNLKMTATSYTLQASQEVAHDRNGEGSPIPKCSENSHRVGWLAGHGEGGLVGKRGTPRRETRRQTSKDALFFCRSSEQGRGWQATALEEDRGFRGRLIYRELADHDCRNVSLSS